MCVYICIQWNLSQQILQIKDTISKTSLISTKNLVPAGVTNTFLISERVTAAKSDQKYLIPKCLLYRGSTVCTYVHTYIVTYLNYN